MDEFNKIVETLELSDILDYCCIFEDTEEIISHLAKGGHKKELDYYRKFIKELEEKCYKEYIKRIEVMVKEN